MDLFIHQRELEDLNNDYSDLIENTLSYVTNM